MNKKLSLPQLLVTLGLLLGVGGFVLFRYFTAPAFTADDPRDKVLHNIAVTEIAVVLGELAPAHVSADAAPRRGGGGEGGGGSMLAPKGEAAKIEAARFAKEVAPKVQKIIDSLRGAGIPVAQDDIAQKAAVGHVPLSVTVTLEGTGTVVENQPTMGVLGYKVELKRDLFTSTTATNPVHLNVAGNMTGSVGVTSPETLAQKQDEALTRAISAIITRWKEDNPAAAKP
ncbi:hypothetical protein [Armatimonas rosea]|uniref:Uncharacterized protein n=1 Tax=Armatimonas rosea TaxID=685828 RepID=A0A7W9W9T4_ARMRO|nr:hypothetical protein [Armatimonas rosea]MBB6053565.1 hypothetical protein [Armatimonas rosea]